MTDSPVHENHSCEVEDCKAWGAFGYARTKAEPIRWWCGKHYPYWGNRTAREEAAEIAAMLASEE